MIQPPGTSQVSGNGIRRVILEQSKRANVGHIGSCLCVVEILTALYSRVLRGSSPTDPERDRFILSKGHSGLALYAAAWLLIPADGEDQSLAAAWIAGRQNRSR